MDEDITDAVTDALSNIPGVGPARKAALYAAGITTRASLAQASVEQLISLTGMPRAQAIKTLEALQATEAPFLSVPSPQIAPPLMDEAMPTAPPLPSTGGDAPSEIPVLPDDDQDPAAANRGILDNAAFRTKTAISDATRVWSLPKLTKSLARLVTVLDTVTEQAADVLRPKATKRLASQLEDLSVWIEKAVADEKPLSEKRRERVRERLKSERIEIEKAIHAASRDRNSKENKSAKSGSREPKRPQKRIKK